MNGILFCIALRWKCSPFVRSLFVRNLKFIQLKYPTKCIYRSQNTQPNYSRDSMEKKYKTFEKKHNNIFHGIVIL